MNNDFKFQNTYTVIDVETTGFSPSNCEIIEISAVKYIEWREVATFSHLIRPTTAIPVFIEELTGITNEMVRGEKTIETVLPRFFEFLGEDVLVGHNITFDINFINYFARKIGLPDIENHIIDTLSISRKLFPELQNHKLNSLSNFLVVSTDKFHRSLSDCLTTSKVYYELSKAAAKKCTDSQVIYDVFKPKHYISNCSDKIKMRKEREFTEDEINYLLPLKTIFDSHVTETLTVIHNAGGVEVCDEYPFLKMKIGRKCYLLIRQNVETLSAKFPDALVEQGSKNERPFSRILLSCPQDILSFSDLIIQNYNIAQISKKNYHKTYKMNKEIPNSTNLSLLINPK